MMKHLRPVVFAVVAVLAASPAIAGDLKLTMQGGRVTLIAQDVPLRQILSEWARIGRTTIVNGDKVTGPALTLQLVDVPERQALDILLRSASGYIAAQRASVEPGASVFDRVMILPTSRPPAQSASGPPPPAFNRPTMAAPMPADEDDEPADAPIMPPGAAPQQMGPGGMPFVPATTQGAPGMPQQPPSTRPGTPGPTVRPGGPGGPGGAGMSGVSDFQPGGPDMPGQGTTPAGQQPVLTIPRPGMLPAPPPPPYVPGGPNPAGRGGQPTKPGGPGGPGGE